MISRRHTTRLAISLCAGFTLCLLTGCSRFHAERASLAHDHVKVVADVPIEP